MLASDYTLNQQEAASKLNLMIISENEFNNEFNTAKTYAGEDKDISKFSNLVQNNIQNHNKIFNFRDQLKDKSLRK